MQVAHDAVDFACLLFLQAKIVGKSSSVGNAFKATDVGVHGAVARGLIGVEITFGKETRHIVAQNTQIGACTGIAVQARAAVEANIAAQVHVSQRVSSPRLMLVAVDIFPASLSHSLRFGLVVGAEVGYVRRHGAVVPSAIEE